VDSAAQPFTFAGEQVDGELGLVYLRARYYDSRVGRLVSADAASPISILPQTINRYPYGGSNPVMLTDSSGKLLGTVIIIGGGAIVVYKIGQWIVDWVGFLDSADKTSNINKEYWRAIDEGNWERASELEEKRVKQFKDTLRRGAKTAWDTPYGTSVSGPPPTSFNMWDAIGEIAGFAIEKAEDAVNRFRDLFKSGQVQI
jgi:RHS repeat-associated protein